MECNYHIGNQITSICKDPHKCVCQRRLCSECLDEHGVDFKNIVSIKKFKEMVNKSIEESQIGQKSELTKQRIEFKLLLSQTENMLKTIWEKLSESIKQIFDMIEMQDESYINFIINPLELSNTELEMSVQMLDKEKSKEWKTQKNSYLKKLDQTKNWWEKEIQTLCVKLDKQILSLNKIQSNDEEREDQQNQESKDQSEQKDEDLQNNEQMIQSNNEESEVYEMKDDLYEILAYNNDIDEKLYMMLIEIFKQEKTSDILEFLSKTDNQRYYENFLNKGQKVVNLQKKIKKIYNSLGNILYHFFSRFDFSAKTYEKDRQDLMNKIQGNKEIIDFIKFLVQLTRFEEKFIQCGSNGLNLLVGMRVDLKNQNYENIKIKNTSLIGINFVRCNLSGSEFNNVDISGMNINGAILLNCKWQNIKIIEYNKLEGHSHYVLSVCFSPDGSLLASGSDFDDKSIGLWDAKTGQLKAKLIGHTNSVQSVCFSPDGTILASGSADKSIRLWDIKTGQCKKELDFRTSAIYSICFSPDGATLASGCSDYSILLWDAKTWKQKAKFEGHTNKVWSVCFSPNGATLASGSQDDSIRVWDVKTGQQTAKLVGHRSPVRSVCFSPDGSTLVSCGEEKQIYLWDYKARQQIGQLIGDHTSVKSVCFSPDGTTLASCGWQRSLHLWDFKTRQQKAKLEGHFGIILSVCFSPDGTKLASGSDDKTIRIWDAKPEQQNESWDKNYRDVLEQLKPSLPEPFNSNFTISLISQSSIFQARSAIIQDGEFVDQSGQNLKPLLKNKGSYFVD